MVIRRGDANQKTKTFESLYGRSPLKTIKYQTKYECILRSDFRVLAETPDVRRGLFCTMYASNVL